MELSEEQEIIEKAKEDPAAFGRIFDEYYLPIFRYAAHRTGNPEAGRDIAAETFYKALNKIRTYRFRGFSISAWLYRIAGNEVNYYFRKKKYEPSLYEDAAGGGFIPDRESLDNMEKELLRAQEEIEKNRNYAAVREAMSSLPEKYQEVLTLRFLEDRKISEISAILGKREGTIKSLISRGIGRIKSIIKP